MKKLIFLMIIAPSLLFANREGTGVSTAGFLEITQGVRAAGMGGAFCGIADDISALYWNPAGLSALKKRELVVSRCFWIADTAIDFAGYAQPVLEGVLGGALIAMDTEGGEEVTDSGKTGKELAVKCSAISASYAKRMLKEIAVGASIKFIKQDYAGYKGEGISYDLGAIAHLSPLSLGLCFQNLGSDIEIENVKNPLPMRIRAGVGYRTRFRELPLLFGFDVEKPRDQDAIYHIGVEHQIIPTIDIRAGFDTQTGASIGFSYRAYGYGRLKNLLGQIDYAYTYNRELESSHRFSILARF
jgi:long-subunit fatty acid transport protein